MKKKVLVRGPALTSSGYGEHARFILRSLRAHEEYFDIFFENINWGGTGYLIDDSEERRWLEETGLKTHNFKSNKGQFDVSIQVTIPNEWNKVAPVNIGVTAGIETTRISPQWVDKCREVDKIIVPSTHARHAFDTTVYKLKNEQTGEEIEFKNKTPIEVVPYPVKDTVPEEIDLDLDCDFNFLTVAQWGPRKNLDSTVKWFVEEFRDEEVGLVIKANTKKNNVKDRVECSRRISHLLSAYPDRKCKVCLVHGNMTEEEMGGLYTHPKVKAIVSTTHGEGFGLPLFEAVYNELPVIAPSWSGHVDFLYAPKKDKKGKVKLKAHFAKVDYNIAPIQAHAVWDGVLQKDSQWCYPKESSFKNAMREAHKNYGTRKSEAKKLAKYIKSTFTKENSYKKIASLISGEEIVEFNIDDIPKISIITSVYDGDDFIEPFLEDITRQTIFESKCELVLVDANSPGNEDKVIKKYIKKFPENIKHFKLDEDPGIYGTWNYAVEKSTGEFITNANLDDRKAINSLERHARELVLNPDVELVYADSLITHRPNETFEKNSSEGKKYNFEQFSKEAMLRGNQPHNNPMWRKTLHEKHGMFESKYKSAGDWEFFLRSAFGGSQFKKINDVLGLYYFNPTGISTNSDNFSWKQKEEKEIFLKYKDQI